ncbi:GMP synthase-Glutamine amidotransferase [Shimia gijangensis]|uniref:GMP synthase-Glutamine amidotransferase n=1 Tax=Shimia gijangensis TaxID=1470563 RepID=A0A1M6CIK3_9RHOB|nr:type 1 glutamine amidotransferase [Shimia gijangensis]SHI60574.1 GMP synthase-Glutamine amidotransferase [Shimia gijangensis]
MKLAILMTNTDESAFAQARPKDGEKFSVLVQEQRPDWECVTFSVKDGDFPEDIQAFDGAMITGSPASVYDDALWVGRLFDLIRAMDASELPVFGACFGHQAIAVALGGIVERNPDGWVHGLAMTESVGELPFDERPNQVGLYASHIEQVTTLPKGAEVVASGPGCAVGGYLKGRHIFTTQYHPEMTDAFIADLVEFTADYVGDEVTQAARESLKTTADRDDFGRQIVQFFEWARRD